MILQVGRMVFCRQNSYFFFFGVKFNKIMSHIDVYFVIIDNMYNQLDFGSFSVATVNFFLTSPQVSLN